MKIQVRILLLMLVGICLSFLIFTGITLLSEGTHLVFGRKASGAARLQRSVYGLCDGEALHHLRRALL